MIKINYRIFSGKNKFPSITKLLGLAILYIVAAILSSCAGTSTGKQEKNVPETTVAIDSMLKDFGEIPQYSNAEATFSIKNTGTHDLILSEVDTDCHCTIASWDSLPVPPGKSAKIKVNFDTKTFGFFQQTVNATLNTKEKVVSFLIRGKVLHAEGK